LVVTLSSHGAVGGEGGLVIMASGFHKLEMGKQGREVSEIRMALPSP
jgi:hypothetical protein